jgi:hypothetical protein
MERRTMLLYVANVVGWALIILVGIAALRILFVNAFTSASEIGFREILVLTGTWLLSARAAGTSLERLKGRQSANLNFEVALIAFGLAQFVTSPSLMTFFYLAGFAPFLFWIGDNLSQLLRLLGFLGRE